MKTLYLDTETYCEVPIKHGTYRYAEDVEIMIVSWAWNDGEITVWDLTNGDATLADVQALIDQADEIVIQNSMFDRTVLRANGVIVPPEKIVDTMVLALSLSLPGSLDTLCDILNVPHHLAKMKDGKRWIHLFCKPLPANRKEHRATRSTHPKEWAEFLTYAGMDIPPMREVRRRLPVWNYPREVEREFWLLDQRINDRGVAVDTTFAEAAMRTAEAAQKRLRADVQSLTEGELESATQRNRVIAYLKDVWGFPVADLTGANVEKVLADLEIPAEVRELLLIREQAAVTSPAKYKALLNGVSQDGRLRGTLQFCGASRTGRDAGRLFQPQNLPRPALKPRDIEVGIEAIKHGTADLLYPDRSEYTVDTKGRRRLLGASVMDLCTSAIRGCLIASSGKKLVVADLSNIEGRIGAWLAREEWKLQAFRDYDMVLAYDGSGKAIRKGPDLYRVTAGEILGKPHAEVTDDERQGQGKVPELACLFGGAVGAFQSMAAIYGVEFAEDYVLQIVRAWRAKHANVVRLWYGLEDAVKTAIRNPNQTFRANALATQCDGAWLRVRLPSGRYLCYAMPTIDETDGGITYAGVNQYTRRWGRLRTYGGKLFENAVQAASRDILFGWVKRAEANGYPVVMRVHDELICEVPDRPEFTAETLVALGVQGESWSEGLPLAAAGFETYRYRKND